MTGTNRQYTYPDLLIVSAADELALVRLYRRAGRVQRRQIQDMVAYLQAETEGAPDQPVLSATLSAALGQQMEEGPA